MSTTKVTPLIITLALSGCFYGDIAVGSGWTVGDGTEETGSESTGSTGPGATSTDPLSTGIASADGSGTSGTTAASDESTATDGTTDTGYAGDCPDGVIQVLNHHCICNLGGGRTRAIDPAECGCELVIDGVAATCECEGEPQILAACGWSCGVHEGDQCICGEFDAPAAWCNLPPPLCEGVAEVVVGDDQIAHCVCSSQFGLPDKALAPEMCGCILTEDGCDCGGALYDASLCAPCEINAANVCVCNGLAGDPAACGA